MQAFFKFLTEKSLGGNRLVCHVQPSGGDHVRRGENLASVAACSGVTRVPITASYGSLMFGLVDWTIDQKAPRTVRQDARRACINRIFAFTTHERSHIIICECEYGTKILPCAAISLSSVGTDEEALGRHSSKYSLGLRWITVTQSR